MTYSKLQYPTMTVYNKTSKKIIFALKRKYHYGYYLFEIHPENCINDEEKQKGGNSRAKAILLGGF